MAPLSQVAQSLRVTGTGGAAMTKETCTFRTASAEDAEALVDLILMAGDGLPEYLWQLMAEPGEDLRSVGRRRARRDEGGFSWRNALVAETPEKHVIAGLLGYPLPDVPEPVELDSLPAPVRPLVALEQRVPGSWYINVVATRPEWRRQGLAQRLMKEAERQAHATGRQALSLIVSSDRHAARALYEAQGFSIVATLPKHADGPVLGGADWVLYAKLLP